MSRNLTINNNNFQSSPSSEEEPLLNSSSSSPNNSNEGFLHSILNRHSYITIGVMLLIAAGVITFVVLFDQHQANTYVSSTNPVLSTGAPRAGGEPKRLPSGAKISRAGKFLGQLECRLDHKLNEKTVTEFKQDLGEVWGSTCGLNRGVFVLKSHPGHTFSCGTLPIEWNAFDGVGSLFGPGRNAKLDLNHLSEYIDGVFRSCAGITPSSCSFAGLGYLYCGEDREQPWKVVPWAQRLHNRPIRGVNIGGLFVLEPWISPALAAWGDDIRDQYTLSTTPTLSLSKRIELFNSHWARFYSEADFKAMHTMGLNTVRLPVGWWYFAELAGMSPDPYIVPTQKILDLAHPITKVIAWANKYDLQVLLDLHGAPTSQNGLDNSGRRSMNENAEEWGDLWFFDAYERQRTSTILIAMTHYVNWLNQQGIHNVLALELINEPWVFGDMGVVRDFYVETIRQIRAVNSTLSIFISDAFRHDEWNWLLTSTDFDWSNIYMDTHLYHAFNPSDIASSTDRCDVVKQVAHENIACGYGGLLRYKTCTSLPTVTGEWSLAIDDCMGKIRGSTTTATQFQDFGQCLNLASRNTQWWTDHVLSFAKRQMFTFERELGWFFWTYKLGAGAEKDPSSAYWSYVEAVTKGYFPADLTSADISHACDHEAAFPQDGKSYVC
eukprot:TRINITY_DN3344_c0_g1_i1.p1 TRINITY_DN3344_c0_g1~~TRINITY_DN3344_c0_g1_i1.p1  ORF type:complete len:664 (-),score=132.58 TRINITY_DN3344_c0_g1_i1:120-2111(-)